MITGLPSPRVPDPRDAPVLGWGVLGTGWIADKFSSALRAATDQRLVAVASRELPRAEAFARSVGAQRAHGDSARLFEDPEVDVVYVASPHHLHLRDASAAMRAGKHVLVEKPLALDAGEARALAQVAHETGRFCMEAMWTLFLPKLDVVRQVVAEGILGEPQTAILDHGEWFEPDHRIWRPELAGGALLDLGTYTYAVADHLLGPGSVVAADVQMTSTGVEGQVLGAVTHASGARSVHHASMLAETPARVVITGTDGLLEMGSRFCMPGPLTLRSRDGASTGSWDEPATGHSQLFWQAAEVARLVAAGATESPLRPLADSVRTLELVDQVREVSGLGRRPAL
ncbi:Gfo/Idh/MocA family protein [Nocardioides acrostichi]|uniref:Gfo/Idh/MocA family oxidoreductase n=1 Tax=Nocardioides acrostichi TaxID=2784339 RepID=A0A930V557_9ACTN|nr:Gfo/Idh/MocA family oxidoreductase [Nocardioides acrostichi]MBF4163369.1 Gfo/Idh/MocA family oxidoreductase [Nocardioides acrostichi]